MNKVETAANMQVLRMLFIWNKIACHGVNYIPTFARHCCGLIFKGRNVPSSEKNWTL